MEGTGGYPSSGSGLMEKCPAQPSVEEQRMHLRLQLRKDEDGGRELNFILN